MGKGGGRRWEPPRTRRAGGLMQLVRSLPPRSSLLPPSPADVRSSGHAAGAGGSGHATSGRGGQGCPPKVWSPTPLGGPLLGRPHGQVSGVGGTCEWSVGGEWVGGAGGRVHGVWGALGERGGRGAWGMHPPPPPLSTRPRRPAPPPTQAAYRQGRQSRHCLGPEALCGGHHSG